MIRTAEDDFYGSMSRYFMMLARSSMAKSPLRQGDLDLSSTTVYVVRAGSNCILTEPPSAEMMEQAAKMVEFMRIADELECEINEDSICEWTYNVFDPKSHNLCEDGLASIIPQTNWTIAKVIIEHPPNPKQQLAFLSTSHDDWQIKIPGGTYQGGGSEGLVEFIVEGLNLRYPPEDFEEDEEEELCYEWDDLQISIKVEFVQ